MELAEEDCFGHAYVFHPSDVISPVQLRWAGHVTRMEDVRIPNAVFFIELQEGKRDRGAPKKRYKDQLKDNLHRWESAVSHVRRRPQTETAGAHQ